MPRYHNVIIRDLKCFNGPIALVIILKKKDAHTNLITLII